MLKFVSDPLVRAIWRGRCPKDMHPRVLFSVRKHLAVLHAALSIDDIKQACCENLHWVEDDSVPFPGSEHLAQPSKLWRIDLGYGWQLYFEFSEGKAKNVSLDCEGALRARRQERHSGLPVTFGPSNWRADQGPPPEPLPPETWPSDFPLPSWHLAQEASWK